MDFTCGDKVIFSEANILYSGHISYINKDGRCVVMCEHRELMSNLEFSQNTPVQILTKADKLYLVRKER